MRIHKEGRFIIPIAAVLISALYALLYWLLPFWPLQWVLGAAAAVFWILIVRFFRHPRVQIPEDQNKIYAPAEGKVVVMERTFEDEVLKEDRIQISIFMSPLNVHVNRSPMAGKVASYTYHKGKYLVAWHPKSSTENERTTIELAHDSGIRLVVRQIAGAVARRIRFYPKVGDTLRAGEEMGFIRFGSRLDVFLPLDAKIQVKIGDKTEAGTTVLATI